jgi:hypothetical protein
MTVEEFYMATGCWPQDDDLERANCEQAGMAGHTSCGICEHGKPVFVCVPCFAATANKPFKRAH